MAVWIYRVDRRRAETINFHVVEGLWYGAWITVERDIVKKGGGYFESGIDG
jgi:hypothetical protein